MKQSTLQATVTQPVEAPDTAMQYVQQQQQDQVKNASQDTFKSIEDDVKQEQEVAVINDLDADMDEEEIGNDYDRQSQ